CPNKHIKLHKKIFPPPPLDSAYGRYSIGCEGIVPSMSNQGEIHHDTSAKTTRPGRRAESAAVSRKTDAGRRSEHREARRWFCRRRREKRRKITTLFVNCFSF